VLGVGLSLVMPVSTGIDVGQLHLSEPAEACCHNTRPPRRTEGTGRGRGAARPGPTRPGPGIRPGSNMPSSLRNALNARRQGRPPKPGQRPPNPEGVLRTALGLPPSGPLTPDQQSVLDDIYSTWEALQQGDRITRDPYDSAIQVPAPSGWAEIGPTPQHVIDRENLIAASRARERELQEWRGWLISKIGGLLISQGGGGMIGAVIWNEVTADPATDRTTMGERAEAKIKGDLAAGALAGSARWVTGRVAERLVPGSGGAAGDLVGETINQVMSDQIGNALKDKYRRNREAAAAFAREHGDQVLWDTFGGPGPRQSLEEMAARTDVQTMRPTPPGSGGGRQGSVPEMRAAPILQRADSGDSGSSIPLMRAFGDSVPEMRAAPNGEVGRKAGAAQARWWAGSGGSK